MQAGATPLSPRPARAETRPGRAGHVENLRSPGVRMHGRLRGGLREDRGDFALTQGRTPRPAEPRRPASRPDTATRRRRGHQAIHLSKPCEAGLEAVSQDCPFSPSTHPLAEPVSRAITAASVPSLHVPAHGRAKPKPAVRLLRVASLPSFTSLRTSSTSPRNNQTVKHRRRPLHQAPVRASWLLRRGGSTEAPLPQPPPGIGLG
jgi:hypothetical protein